MGKKMGLNLNPDSSTQHVVALFVGNHDMELNWK
jgi:hypothetical protein